MPPETTVLLRSFSLTRGQRREVFTAWKEEPVRVHEFAVVAQEYGRQHGTSGAGLLLTMLRRGDHYPPLHEQPRDPRPITGWKWVRGSHGSTHVADPDGRDPLPKGFTSG